jgi:hypothetical protein
MYKDFQTKIEDVDDKGRVLVAANALGNVDADEDISMEGSFTKTLKENFHRLRWFLNHNKEILLGVPIEGKEEYPHLKMLGQLNMKKEISRDTYEDYKLYAEYGRSLEHSIGVTPVKEKQDGKIRRVYEWKMWEYSTLTSWGANENTPLLGIKSDKDIPGVIDWLELRLKKGNYTDERFIQIEKQLFTLRSLCIEPDSSTQVAQPDVREQDESLVHRLNNIDKLFKENERWQTLNKIHQHLKTG